jgi:signal transduction histidine kinase
LESPNHELAKLLQSQVVSFAIRHEEGVGDLLVAFGGDTSPVDPIRRRILLTALARQACLVIVTYILQKDLDQASRKLGEAQEHLLEKEKLAVVGTLAASTAHDIRNILASLSLLISSEQERSGPESGSQKDDNGLTAIREQIRRFDVLAHRLLSYAKPQMIVTQPVELPKVIDSVLAVTAGHFRVGKITLLRSVQKNLPRVAGDPHEYEHLLVNLVLNGVQSMNNSGGSLRINVKRKGSTVSVSVSDTGSGLSDEIKDRLFEPFASTRSDGFGLGLFSCRRIVEHHGGAISARRNPQKGTTFTVLLPVYGELEAVDQVNRLPMSAVSCRRIGCAPALRRFEPEQTP